MPDGARCRRRERGSATVEFALVLPLVLALLLALVQIGILARDRMVLEHAARAGAREAAVTLDAARVRAAVLEAGPTLGEATGVTVARAGSVGDAVSVRVVSDRSIRVPLVGWLFPRSVEMKATATMRQEIP